MDLGSGGSLRFFHRLCFPGPQGQARLPSSREARPVLRDYRNNRLTLVSVELAGWDEAKYKEALAGTGYPAEVDKSRINYPMTVLILFILVLYVTMVYGPIAAFLVELFPTRIRYTSMSLPYHIGNGWFGGMLPLLATAMVARAGNIYAGLWYPIAISLMTVVVGALFLRETKDRSINE